MEVNEIHHHDVTKPWKMLPDKSVHCIVTSPPYYGLRDCGIKGQIGLEESPEKYIRKLVKIFREAKRVLRNDGTMWINIGDSYAHNGAAYGNKKSTLTGRRHGEEMGKACRFVKKGIGLKPKDLIGIPWMLAFALRADGWYLRSDIIWAKKNCMPESVTDRPTRSHEYIFLLSKSPKYFYDHQAIKEPAIYDVDGTGTASRKARQKEGNKSMPLGLNAGIRPPLVDNTKAAAFLNAAAFDGKNSDKQRGHSRRHDGFNDRWDKMEKEEQCTGMRNKRDVWSMATAQFPGSHFAVFPEELPSICIKAGTSEHGCCVDCGTPYKRILKPSQRYGEILGTSYHDHSDNAGKGMMQNRGTNLQNNMRDAGIAGAEYVTAGWAKTCKCKGLRFKDVVPCVVLDPFSGAGTTFLVARKLGRDAVGLELSPKYIAMSIKRLQKELGLFI